MAVKIKLYEARIGLLWRTVELLRLEILSNYQIIERLSARCDNLYWKLHEREGSSSCYCECEFSLADKEKSYLWN